MKRNRRKAFTLIEVLVVVMILAMLAAFAVTNLVGASEEAKRDLAKAAVGGNGPIASSLQRFYKSVGRYPSTDEGLMSLVTKPSGIEDNPNSTWTGPYIQDSRGLNDPWGNVYGYKCPGDVNQDSFDLWSNGKDGQQGTEDDVTNWLRETGSN